MRTIKEWLHEAAGQLASLSTTAMLDVEILLAHGLNVPRSYLHTHPERKLSVEEAARFSDLVKRRAEGQPIAYITGHCEFWSLDLMVTPATLIPRPETELLVELLLKNHDEESLVIADLGTGSGAIALAIAHERPNWTVYATDSSKAALDVAKMNAERLQLHNIIFCHGYWCKALPDIHFDRIVSNPPYVAENDPQLEPAVLATEPLSALIAGADGLKDIRHIVQEASAYLKPGGCLLIEHGFSQAESVQNEFLKVGYTHVTSVKDFSGLNRVTSGVFDIYSGEDFVR